MIDWNVILTGILGSGCIGSIFFFRENRKAKQIENEKNAADVWQELFERSEARCANLSERLDALYKENAKFRDENNALTTRNAVLELQKCLRNGCASREPPREW